MADVLTVEQRSRNMRAIKQKDTKPELRVRKYLHSRGYRYRIHRRDLPGNPDVVFPSRRKIIFIHGCFWHGHNCRLGTPARTKQAYWIPKIAGNKARDSARVKTLRASGWKVLVVWECDVRRWTRVSKRLTDFLGPPHS